MGVSIKILVINVFLLTNICFGHINYPITNNSNSNHIAICVNDIADKDYYKQVVIVLKSRQDNAEDEIVHNIIKKIVNEKPLLITEMLDQKEPLDIYNENTLVVMYLGNCKAITNFNTNNIELKVKYLVIILKYCKNYLNEIRDVVAVFDVTFILVDGINEHEIVTFIPHVNEKTCKTESDMESVHLDVCNNGLTEKNEIFPTKNPVGLNGCPLKVGITLLVPFTKVKKDKNYTDLEPMDEVFGSDIDMLNIIAQHLNGKLKYYHVGRKREDFQKFLQNGTLDICAGGFSPSVSKQDVIEYSGTYNTQGLIWIYSAKRTPMAWERIKSRITVLFPFFLIYICYCSVFICFNYFDGRAMNISNTFLYSWGSLFGAASITRPQSLKHSILMLFFLQSCFYLSLFINGDVFTYLTIQLPPKIYKNQEDILASGKNCFILPIFNTGYFSTSSFQHITKNCQKCSTLDECNRKVLLNDGLTLSLDGMFYSLQVATAQNYEATVLKVTQNVFNSNVFMLRKDSPFVDRIQRLVQRMYETGMADKLFRKEIGLGVKTKALRFSKNLRRNNKRCVMGCRVKLATLAPLFYIWMFGCLLSCFSFVLEVMSKRFSTQ